MAGGGGTIGRLDSFIGPGESGYLANVSTSGKENCIVNCHLVPS